MGNILHGTKLNTLPQSHCIANVQALGHHFNLSPNTQLRLSQGLIETLPSCPLFRADSDHKAHEQVICDLFGAGKF